LRGFTGGVETSFLMRNIIGTAELFTSTIDVLGRIPNFYETYQATAALRFDQPYMFNNDNSWYLSSSYSISREQTLAQGQIFQATMGAQRRLSGRSLGQLSWTYEISRFTGDPKALFGHTVYSGIDLTETINFRNSIRTFMWEKDWTNDFFNPTSGLYLKGTLEEAGYLEKIGISPLPLANDATGMKTTEYYKMEGFFKSFRDISRNATSIVALKLRMGAIIRYGDSKRLELSVPPNRRYYAGGASSIRGWGARQLAADTAFLNIGSNALLESSVELRWQLFPSAKKWLAVEPDRIWLVFFADAGNLWEEASLFRFNQIALSVGVGFRYNLFFGPIRVDFGMKAFDPSAPDDKWMFQRRFIDEIVKKGVFQFGIGHAF
jgi:outer membrane protein assembly factor BamA